MVSIGRRSPLLEIHPESVGKFWLDTTAVPYVYLEREEAAQGLVRVGDTEYTFDHSYPVRGHSAIMPQKVRELMAEGKRLLVVEHGERLYVYLA
jgi:hypothetical protein